MITDQTPMDLSDYGRDDAVSAFVMYSAEETEQGMTSHNPDFKFRIETNQQRRFRSSPIFTQAQDNQHRR